MGVVYKAYDSVTRRHVAIKTMRGSIDPAALELFSKEWTVLSRINHPNIIDLFDTGEFEEDRQKKPFFVMPFLQGKTLDFLIKNVSLRLTVERVTEIVMQTCRGLQAAHENGLVHRDLKPSNIFVMDDDTVKIIDFGVVYLAGSETITGLKGTLQYMAPEQIDMKPTSPASDIFSLGVVCYEALTGRKPFARRTDTETVEALRHHIPPPVGELNPLVSQLVSRVVHKAMAKAPYHRFSSAKEFSETLQKALANQPIERFDKAKTQPRIERAKKALAEGDLQFGSELLSELEAEGHLDPEMTVLRIQINQGIRQKSIRQLLETARSRREENEFPLALQKIQEVLEIDPDNADALSLRQDVEKEMSNRQVENWFRLVEQHIHHRSFAQAREALQEILKLDSKNSRACELLVDVERREKEMNRVRGEKEQLYKAALNNYEEGEVSSALSKLERVLEFSRTAPDSETPDRDAQYQRLYDQIRTERDAVRNAYATGRRHLADKNFDKALEICNEYLNRYPTDALFQALKLEIEENKRQEYSSFLASVVQRADAEPDLDRRVNILKEAAERYPDETHFQQSLRLTRERRDLVNAIVARARQYEERGQFGDALSQWDILRNIHAQYPGIGFEVERLTRRRDEQLREEAKARWVAQIDQMRAAGDYAKARELVRAALAEFPQDRELSGLDKLTQQDLERAKEAETWLQRGQKLCFERAYGEGLEALRKASGLDGSNPVIRAALLNALVEQARSVLGQDWRAAEPLVLEALRIDGSNPVVRGLEGLVLDYKRKEMVDDSLARARDLQAAGDLPGALRTVEEALRSFPSELRLVQLRDTLRKSLPAKETPLRADERPAVPVSDRPAEPKAMATAVNSMGPSETSMLDHSLNKTVLYPSQPVVREPAKPATPVERQSKQAPSAPKPPGPRPSPIPLFGFSRIQWAAISAFPILLVIVIVYQLLKPPVGPPKPPKGNLAATYAVNVSVEPSLAAGTQLFVDNTAVSQFPAQYASGNHVVEARAAGYKTATQSFTAGQGGSQSVLLRLTPELLRVHIASDLKAGQGQVLIDDTEKSDLQEDGSFSNDQLSLSAEHKLALLQGQKEILSFTFSGEPGKMALLTSPIKANDLSFVVISNLASRSVIYSSNPALKVGVGNETPQPIPAGGLELSNVQPGSEVVLVDGGNARPLPIDASNAPGLTLLLKSDPNTATLQVELGMPDTSVAIKGGRSVRRVHGTATTYQLPPGKYTIVVSKDGYDPEERTIELKKGATEKLAKIDLKPVEKAPPPPPPPPSTLFSIQGGTPGVEILVDNQSVGTTAANGSWSGKANPGPHSIILRKAGYEEKEIKMSFVAGQTVTLTGEATLSLLGSLTFDVKPDTAQIAYSRDGEGQNHTAKNGTVPVKQGRYTVQATAPGMVARSVSVNVAPGKNEKIELTLNPVPPVEAACVFDASQWTKDDDGWEVHKGSSAPGALCRSKGNIALQVRPTARFLKRVEWNLEYGGSANRIEYRLDHGSIERKVFTDNKEDKAQRAKKEDIQLGEGAAWPLELHILADKITITSGSKVLDTYERPDGSTTPSRVVFKGDVQLKLVQR